MAKIIDFKTRAVLADLFCNDPGLPREVRKWDTESNPALCGCSLTVIAFTRAQAECILFSTNLILRPTKKVA